MFFWLKIGFAVEVRLIVDSELAVWFGEDGTTKGPIMTVVSFVTDCLADIRFAVRLVVTVRFATGRDVEVIL